MYVYVNHTYLYNWSPPPGYLTTGVLNDSYSEVMAYAVLAYSYWAVSTMRKDAYATPTKDTDYNYQIKAIELILTIIWGLYHATSPH